MAAKTDSKPKFGSQEWREKYGTGKKTGARKTAAKKTATKKPAARKTAAKKPAARKAAK